MSSNEVPVTVLSSLEAATTIGKGDVCRFEDIVDIQRYPILDLNSSQGKDLLLQCKEEFDRTGSLSLKGFIRENMITKMYEEIKPLITVAHRRLELVNPFGILATDYMDKEVERTGKPLPPDHALKHRLAQDVNAVANDQIPAECMVNVVYKSETFHAFIAAIVDAPKLFIYGDEFQSLNLMYIKDGGSRGWHFDNSDFVVVQFTLVILFFTFLLTLFLASSNERTCAQTHNYIYTHTYIYACICVCIDHDDQSTSYRGRI